MSVIHVLDDQDQIEIGFVDIEKYHGKLALMAVAVSFRAQQAAFKVLFGAVSRSAKRFSSNPAMRDRASGTASNT
ncbi:hypothetical protein ACHHV8_00960 [Paenibacillus sp. TAB 01]|uniref:hypothetical protein n=1 Tax=Paenibacillus sp. TAB 01 TaxID=3368988 RepID=UPI003750EE01